jgi:glycine hydroxymethyltransferase
MGKDFPNPWKIKTPKGEIKMMSAMLDGAVFPGTQGGPLEHVIAGKAVAFKEALSPDFKTYQEQVVKNCKVLAHTLQEHGIDLVSGGTDNHLVLVKTDSVNMSGKEAGEILERVDITCNKNMVPNDKRSPFVTSGIRLGTPAVTTRGFKEAETKLMAELIVKALKNSQSESILQEVKQTVHDLCVRFPVYK